MTRAQLAVLMEVKAPSVHDWENGGTAPSLDKIPKLARVLETSIDDLLGVKAS